ncbi:MAG: uracil-DNA glycosylase [Planctomycetota bacterium]
MTNLPDHWPAESDWTNKLAKHFESDSFGNLMEFVKQERQNETIYPLPEHTFRAFQLTSFEDLKVVILGQDPYHGAGQAHGLSFSVDRSLPKLPPSLRNIFKELASDLDCQTPIHGDLTHWAAQGVFLLNTVLTVRQGAANSHRKQGWEQFTDEVIRQINKSTRGVVFILWGKPAEKKELLISNSHHVVIKSPHPSPLSARRGFFGSQPFSRANEALKKMNQQPIQWS